MAMKVTKIAETVFDDWEAVLTVDGTRFSDKHGLQGDFDPDDIEKLGDYSGDTDEQLVESTLGTTAEQLVEFAGRACYQAWGMPNPKTEKTPDYVKNIVRQEHYSVLEHASVTFYIEGVSRALTHELIRHRHLSYSELSQRYVDVRGAEAVIPPAFTEAARRAKERGFDYPFPESIKVVEELPDLINTYETWVEVLMEEGFTRKEAREAARAYMPNMTETKIVVTGNLRAWRDFLGKRWHVAADAEIRELAGKVLLELRKVSPAAFSDIPEVPFGFGE